VTLGQKEKGQKKVEAADVGKGRISKTKEKDSPRGESPGVGSGALEKKDG